jgi:hypothetical protein
MVMVAPSFFQCTQSIHNMVAVQAARRLAVTMPAEIAALIKDAVAGGNYASTSEVVREGTRASHPVIGDTRGRLLGSNLKQGSRWQFGKSRQNGGYSCRQVIDAIATAQHDKDRDRQRGSMMPARPPP